MNIAALHEPGGRPHIAADILSSVGNPSGLQHTFCPHVADLAMVNRIRGFIPQGITQMPESIGHR